MSGTNTPDEHERLELPPAVGVGAGQGGDYKAFGLTETYNAFLPMLEIQFRTGDRSAFAYHTLGRAEFNPSTGITLTFSDLVVTLRGRALDALFVAIRQQQAVFVCEADRATRELVPPAVPLVESVTVDPARRSTPS